LSISQGVSALLPRLVTLCVLLSPLTAGCARLSPGDPADIASPRSVNVCLIRGYLDWYSTGIDTLATQLRAEGINAESFREEQWDAVADAIAAHPHRPMVLIGFSYGADDVILISRRLAEKHLTVDLLITIDPVTPATVPANVKRCVNFYEPNGLWDILPWLRGVPVTGDTGAKIENINIRTRTDLDEPQTSHGTIAANQKVHKSIETLVGALVYQRR
jgi:pimeloyl-ACP methyl ester carboxylesterase